MIFVDKVVDDYKIERVDVEGIGRHYKIELKDGSKHLFPSMTTILSFEGDKDYIIAWKKRVGEALAYAKTKQATDAGTELHLFCEYIMLRQFDKAVNLHQTTKDRRAKFYMKKIAPYLKRFKKIFASEEFMFSLKYRIAGTTDAVVGLDDGLMYILDFKTASTMKSADSIVDYYIQVAGYAMMWEFITGIVVDDAIILMVTPYQVQEFTVSLVEYKKDFENLVNNFYAKYGDDYQRNILNQM